MSMYDELVKLEESKKSPTSKMEESEKLDKRIPTQKSTLKNTRKLTQQRKPSSDKPRNKSREKSRKRVREVTNDLPTRDEIQEFSFRLRDELKAKVQAEVPHQWPKELEEIARQLNVKKLELYRFILGEFLGKVKRKASS